MHYNINIFYLIKYCIVDKVEDESQNIIYIKIKYDGSDAEIELDPEQTKALIDKVELTVRLNSKTGDKSIIKGFEGTIKLILVIFYDLQ